MRQVGWLLRRHEARTPRGGSAKPSVAGRRATSAAGDASPRMVAARARVMRCDDSQNGRSRVEAPLSYLT